MCNLRRVTQEINWIRFRLKGIRPFSMLSTIPNYLPETFLKELGPELTSIGIAGRNLEDAIAYLEKEIIELQKEITKLNAQRKKDGKNRKRV